MEKLCAKKDSNKGSPILRKACKPVEKFDEKLSDLIDDMIQTLAKGAGSRTCRASGGIFEENFYYGYRRGTYRMR